MSDQGVAEYLQSSVGEIIARGIAETIEAKPSDPVEYLAVWLLHTQQLRTECAPKREAERQELEKQRKEFEIQQEKERAEAAIKIQEQIRAALVEKTKRQAREKELLKEYEEEKESFDDDFEEDYEESPEQGGEDGEEPAADASPEAERKSEALKELALEKARVQMIVSHLKKLGANYWRKFRGNKRVTKDSTLYNLGKTILLLNDTKYKDIPCWKSIRTRLPKDPEAFEALVSGFEAEKRPQRQLKYKRSKRCLRAQTTEDVKAEGIFAYLIHEWGLAVLACNASANAAAPFLPAPEEEAPEDDEEEGVVGPGTEYPDDPYGDTQSEADWQDPDIVEEAEGEGEGEENGEGEAAEGDE